MQILFEDYQILRMSQAQIHALAMLCPKHVFFQMETSGSPSAWTDYGEYRVGHSGIDIVRCAESIIEKDRECEGTSWNYRAHIRVVF